MAASNSEKYALLIHLHKICVSLVIVQCYYNYLLRHLQRHAHALLLLLLQWLPLLQQKSAANKHLRGR